MLYQSLVSLLTFFSFTGSLPAENTWKIGALLCLSGECASSGDNALKGAQIAVRELNEVGGVLGKKIELVVQDTSEAVSGAKAVNAYRELQSNNTIHYIIGPTWTPGGLSLVPILKKDRDVIITSPSLGAAAFHMSADNVFNTHGTDEATTRKVANYAYQNGFRKIAIFSSQQPWESLQADFFEEEFEKLGGEIAVRVDPLPTISILNAEALKIIAAKPDAIFMSVVVQQAVAAKELRKLNFTPSKFAALVDDARLQEAEGALESTIFFSYQMPSDEFKTKFQSQYKTLPEIPAAVAYDTVYAYAKAAQKVQSFDIEAVKEELSALEFNGASGEIHFDKFGCVEKNASGWKVRGAKLEAIN